MNFTTYKRAQLTLSVRNVDEKFGVMTKWRLSVSQNAKFLGRFSQKTVEFSTTLYDIIHVPINIIV